MTSNSKEQLSEVKSIFIRIPKSVYDNEALNDTEKYLYGALLSLSKLFIRTGTNTGIPIQTSKLSKMIKISVRTIQRYLITLSDKKLLAIECINGQRRIFLWNMDEDAYCLIPDEMTKDPLISVPYKLSYGLAFVSMNGYTYQTFNELKTRLNLSTSSAYRHIHVLVHHKYLNRDISASGYRFLAMDTYSKAHREKQRLSPDKKVYKTGERATERIQKAPPIKPDPEGDIILDRIWKAIK